MNVSILLIVCVLLIGKPILCVEPIILQNGQIFSSLIYSGETILFGYHITDPCSDISVFLTGDADAYISPVETFPNVYSYSIYSFTCNGDAIHIDHDDAYFSTGLWYISVYLDPLVYDSFTNMTVRVEEIAAQNIVSFSSSVLVERNSLELLNVSDSFRICFRDASKGVTFLNENTDGTEVTIILCKLNPSYPYFDAHLGITHFHSSSSGTFINNWIDFYSYQSQQNIQFQFNSSYTLDSLPFNGNYWMTIQPSCLLKGDNACSPVHVNMTISSSLLNASLPNVTSLNYVQLTSGYSVSNSLSIGAPKYYKIEVGVCDDLNVRVSSTQDLQVIISTSSFTEDSINSIYSWKLNVDAGNTENITISYKDPSFSAGTFFIALFTSFNSNSFTITATTALGTDALASGVNELFSYSNFVASNEIKWYSVCIVDKERGLNITTTWHNLTGGYGFETVDIIATRIPFLDTNYTHFISSGTPSKNFWANWAYPINPFPGCKESFLLIKNNTSIYYPGVIYIGMYSFCLPSCNYCHGDIWFSFSVQFADNDLSRCLVDPNSQLTTGISILPQESTSQVKIFSVYVILLLVIVFAN